MPLRIGPDGGNDVRKHRPYYLIQLDGSAECLEEAVSRLSQDIQQDRNIPISDIIIFCHGWHRHIRQVITAYDRLFRRLPLLINGGQAATGKGRPFNPLYVGIQWTSGVETDREFGRRRKEDFDAAIRGIFPPDVWNYNSVVDRFYDLFVSLSSRTDEAFSDPDLDGAATALWLELNQFRFAGNGVQPDNAQKLSILWDCYTKGGTIRAEEPQTDKAVSFRSLFRIDSVITVVAIWLAAHFLGPSIHPLITANTARVALYLSILSAVAYVIISAITDRIVKVDSEGGVAATAAMNAIVLLAKTPALIVLLCFNAIAYGCGQLMAWAFFSEKAPLSGELDRWGRVQQWMSFGSISESLAKLILIPNHLARIAWPKRHFRRSLSSLLDSQCSFWQMQRRATQTGISIADLCRKLYSGNDTDARLHFVGHSFGSLAVSNTVRALTSDESFGGNLTSLCLLQGALRSDWFRSEAKLVDGISETLSCIYSRYDRANSLWYPIANSRRKSAGSVGLCAIGGIEKITARKALIYPYHVNPHADTAAKHVYNVDASYLIYDGDPISGGHEHIFSDEALLLVWSMTIGPSVHIGDIYPEYDEQANG